MSKEIRAIEISRESLSVGSTFTESIALQSSLSAQFTHWSKSLTGFMLAAWSVVCQTPRGRDRRLLSSSRLQKKLEQFVPGQWCLLGLFPSPSQKAAPALAAGPCGGLKLQGKRVQLGLLLCCHHIPHFHHASCPLSQDFKKSDVMQSSCIWLCVLAYCWVLSHKSKSKTTKPKPQSRSRFLSAKNLKKASFAVGVEEQ